MATDWIEDERYDDGRPQWMDDAACRGVGPADFFVDRGGAGDTAAANAWCAVCPVRIDCLLGALVRHERDGCWGGTTEKDRRVMLRAWSRGLPARVRPLPVPGNRLLLRPPFRQPFGCGANCTECSALQDEALGGAIDLWPPDGWTPTRPQGAV